MNLLASENLLPTRRFLLSLICDCENCGNKLTSEGSKWELSTLGRKPWKWEKRLSSHFANSIKQGVLKLSGLSSFLPASVRLSSIYYYFYYYFLISLYISISLFFLFLLISPSLFLGLLGRKELRAER